MKIRVDSETAIERLDIELDKVQHRCTARAISAEDIVLAAKKISKHLDIPACKMDGCVADVDIHAQRFPSAYRYIPDSTHFTLTNTKGKWSVTNIFRDRCRENHCVIMIEMPQETKNAIVAKHCAFYI